MAAKPRNRRAGTVSDGVTPTNPFDAVGELLLIREDQRTLVVRPPEELLRLLPDEASHSTADPVRDTHPRLLRELHFMQFLEREGQPAACFPSSSYAFLHTHAVRLGYRCTVQDLRRCAAGAYVQELSIQRRLHRVDPTWSVLWGAESGIVAAPSPTYAERLVLAVAELFPSASILVVADSGRRARRYGQLLEGLNVGEVEMGPPPLHASRARISVRQVHEPTYPEQYDFAIFPNAVELLMEHRWRVFLAQSYCRRTFAIISTDERLGPDDSRLMEFLIGPRVLPVPLPEKIRVVRIGENVAPSNVFADVGRGIRWSDPHYNDAVVKICLDLQTNRLGGRANIWYGDRRHLSSLPRKVRCAILVEDEEHRLALADRCRRAGAQPTSTSRSVLFPGNRRTRILVPAELPEAASGLDAVVEASGDVTDAAFQQDVASRLDWDQTLIAFRIVGPEPGAPPFVIPRTRPHLSHERELRAIAWMT